MRDTPSKLRFKSRITFTPPSGLMVALNVRTMYKVVYPPQITALLIVVITASSYECTAARNAAIRTAEEKTAMRL